MHSRSKLSPWRSCRWQFIFAFMLFCSVSAPFAALAAPADATGKELLIRVARAVDTHIVPAFETLAARTRDLTEAVERHCENADIGSLKVMESAFAGAADAWAAAEHLRFGPLRDSERVARFQFWPDPRGITVRQMRAVYHKHDAKLLEPENLEKQSVAILGLGAIEYYLLFERKAFEDGSQTRSDDYECLYTREVARLVDKDASEILSEWTRDGGWRARLENPSPAAEIFRSEKESAAQLVKSLLLGLQLVRDQRIVPLYELANGDAKTARVPFQRLGLTDETIRASLVSLHQLNDALGLSDFATGRTAWVKDWTEQGFSVLEREAQSVSVPDRSQLEPGDLDLSTLRKLRFYTNGLRQVIARQTAPSAGLTIGFNELDGD